LIDFASSAAFSELKLDKILSKGPDVGAQDVFGPALPPETEIIGASGPSLPQSSVIRWNRESSKNRKKKENEKTSA